jgi:hypothetical protein
MNRFAFARVLALLLCATVSITVFAQAQTAAPTTPAPAAKAKFATPVKGNATIDVVQNQAKFVGKEIVTVYKIKNTSNAPIALLKIDEYWYDKAGKMVSSDTYRHRQPFLPGEVIEVSTKSPVAPGAERSQAQFSHANGTVKPNRVKAIK